MGLTIHFRLSAPASLDSAGTRELVDAARAIACRMQRRGAVEKVAPLRWDAGARRMAVEWLTVPVPGQRNTFTGLEVEPTEGNLFCVEIGQDCEPLRLGLCRYPATVRNQGQLRRTRLGRDWQLKGFSKTQYASLHGWEHFLRCHRAVVDLLLGCQRVGMGVTISDEGGYWPGRRTAALRQILEEMNGVVAAAAGALKDLDDGSIGPRVKSPIFAHARFERLEAEGVAQVGPRLGRLVRAVKNAPGKP
jgi:hypothetical protein